MIKRLVVKVPFSLLDYVAKEDLFVLVSKCIYRSCLCDYVFCVGFFFFILNGQNAN